MIIGIEETTDHQHPETRIVRLPTRAAAVKWLTEEGVGDFAWPGAATHSERVTMQNWHRRVRQAYEMPHGFRLKKSEVDLLGDYHRMGGRPIYGDGARARVYRRHAVAEVTA